MVGELLAVQMRTRYDMTLIAEVFDLGGNDTYFAK